MKRTLDKKQGRLLHLLAAADGEWDDAGRCILRIATASQLKRLRVESEMTADLHRAQLVMVDAKGIRLTPSGRAWVAAQSDHPDAFRLQHGAVVEQTVDAGKSSQSLVRVDESESPLRWLRRRRGNEGSSWIDDTEFDAGERLRADFTRAGLMPSITSNWRDMQTRTGGGNPAADLTDSAIAARDRVTRALTALGPELAGIAIDVCCFLKGLETVEAERRWPARCGKVVLKLALQALARHYGLSTEARGVPFGRLQRWSQPDGRPGAGGKR